MHCPHCGARNADDAYFCTRCGQALHPEAVPLTLSARLKVWFKLMPRWLPIALAAIILLLLASLIAVGMSQRQEPSSTLIAVPQESPSPSATSSAPPPSATPTPTATPTFTPAPSATPTATPTLTPSRTPLPTATPSPSATPTPTKKPKPSCRRAKKGLIGFKRQKRCDKKTGNACGPVEIWVMNADGSGQARMCNPKAYTWGLTRDRTSPDGKWRVEVGGRRPDIMRLWLDTGRQEMIIVNNRKDWDPVLSADGWWLAWVTNRNGNDEIYIKTMDPADQHQRRLTENSWEWDKHPTWSPDGRKIAFYSNRADSLGEATRQIWVMEIVNDKGVNLRNLSQRPDRVDTDPVWFKWDDMPY